MDVSSTSELREANEWLADPPRLGAKFDADGYLFFRDVLDQDAVRDVGRQVIETVDAFNGQGLVLPRDDSRLQDALNAQRLWEHLVAVPAIASFFAKVAGAPVGFIPLARYRVMPPGDSTQVHQDAYLNPGFAMTTAWIPLVPVDEELGGLAVAAGSHRHGCMSPESMPPLDGLWRWARYEPGDVVLMHEAMVHAGLPNRSGSRLRVSVDVRFQNPGAAPAVVGRIGSADVDAVSVCVEGDEGEVVVLAVDDSTLLRGSAGQIIPRSELPASDLSPGRRVIASQRDGFAVMVRPI